MDMDMAYTVLEFPFWEEPSHIFKTILRPVVDVTLRPNQELFDITLKLAEKVTLLRWRGP